MLLTLKQKLELPVTEKFEKGESVKKLANDYGIGVQTVIDIKKNKEKLIEFSRNCQFNDWQVNEGIRGEEEWYGTCRKRRYMCAACYDLQCVGTLLDCVEQWDFNYSDIVTLRNIRKVPL